MTRVQRIFVTLLVGTALGSEPALAQTRPSNSLPSEAELHEMFQHERYQDVIRQIVRILPIKGEAASQWDRYELLVLKGEAHLRLGDANVAAKAFEEAGAAASAPADAATARATAVLIRRGQRDGYAPRTGALAGEPLQFVEPDGRKLALKALYADECASNAQRLSAAAEAEDLDALLHGLDIFLALRDFELAAAGGDHDSQAALAPLADRAQQHIKQQIKSMSSRIQKLDKSANSKKKMGSHYRKRGLARDELSELRAHADECRRFIVAAQRLGRATASESHAKQFTELRRDAQQLATRIEEMLAADYGGLYDRN